MAADSHLEDEQHVSQAQVGAIIRKLSSGSDEERAAAAYDLDNLASDPENQRLLGQAGAIPPLVMLVAEGSAEQKRLAASALCHLAEDSENQMSIVLAQAVGPLVALARDGTEPQKQVGANALGQLAASNSANQKIIGCVRLLSSGTALLSLGQMTEAFAPIPRVGSTVPFRHSPSSRAVAPPTRKGGPRKRSATSRLLRRTAR